MVQRMTPGEAVSFLAPEMGCQPEELQAVYAIGVKRDGSLTSAFYANASVMREECRNYSAANILLAALGNIISESHGKDHDNHGR